MSKLEQYWWGEWVTIRWGVTTRMVKVHRLHSATDYILRHNSWPPGPWRYHV